ncbi:MAG TPA: nitroreductase family protein, partial [Armatimonadota bacterium]|nr:nitroreductase family protein [Armatimonadota bacterium]
MAKRCMFGVILTLVAVMIWYTVGNSAENPTAAQQTTITLPAVTTSTVTVEQAMRQRRSVRSYANEPLTLQQVSQLLWAAQGITEPTKGLRTAPSAMAMYPLR